ncbi:MAG: pirin family protein [Rubrivivax sp.]|nr:pirin family protein [Rubrivivax sp.]
MSLLRLTGHTTDLAAGLTVRRLLPAAARRAVGPFVFFDHFGPVTLPAEADSDVGAHPHIGLATVTWLFEGRLMHRDSLGTVQAIAPGEVNWMTAGHGIVHSERTPPEERGRARRLHGLQLWVALPPALEATDPAFQHVGAADLPPVMPATGVRLRVLVGTAFGATSPVRPASPTLYLDVRLDAGVTFTLPPLAPEMAIYAPLDALRIDGETLPPRTMAVAAAGAELRIAPDPTSAANPEGAEGTAAETGSGDGTGAHFVVIGGAPIEQPVRMWWNFVATDRERIAAAAARWQADAFPRIPGETTRVAAPPWRG